MPEMREDMVEKSLSGLTEVPCDNCKVELVLIRENAPYFGRFCSFCAKPKSFDGKTYDPAQDEERLSGQLQRVKHVLSDGKERTLEQVANEANVPLSTVGSRIRDLRKDFAGALPVCSRRVSKGLWVYWVPQQPKIVFDDHNQGLFGFEGWAA